MTEPEIDEASDRAPGDFGRGKVLGRRTLGGIVAGTGAAAISALAFGDRTAKADAVRAFPWVDAKDFGAVGDGVADDTAALQKWVVDIVERRTQGWLPNGTYKITETLIVPGG